MMRRTLGFALPLVLALVVAGCSRTGESRTAAEEGAAPAGTEASDAAAGRGVASGEGDAEISPNPRIVLNTIEYEWTLEPEKGLHVALDFSNPNQGYGRAKGYAFVLAGSSQDAGVRGVYPWSARLEGGEPADYKAGGRLLYRTEQRMTVFIPYDARAGCYDTVRVLVYDNDGAVVTDQTHELPITGEPSGRRAIEQTLLL